MAPSSSTDPSSSSHHGIHLPHIHLPGTTSKPPPPAPARTTSTRLTAKPSRTAAHTSRHPPPPALNRQNSTQTRYMNMLLALDTIPRLHTILASFFTWILLAGFIIFPGTFTALGHVEGQSDSQAAKYFFQSVKNVPLLVIAGVCCGIGAAGMVWLWWRWWGNYVWVLNRIFLPGCLNSFAGLISTLINVYTQQNGVWNTTARVSAIVAGSIMIITGLLFAIYNFVVLDRVKKLHTRDMAAQGSRGGGSAGAEGEETLREKLAAPALEPGSVV